MPCIFCRFNRGNGARILRLSWRGSISQDRGLGVRLEPGSLGNHVLVSSYFSLQNSLHWHLTTSGGGFLATGRGWLSFFLQEFIVSKGQYCVPAPVNTKAAWVSMWDVSAPCISWSSDHSLSLNAPNTQAISQTELHRLWLQRFLPASTSHGHVWTLPMCGSQGEPAMCHRIPGSAGISVHRGWGEWGDADIIGMCWWGEAYRPGQK